MMVHNLKVKSVKQSFRINFQIKTMSYFHLFSENEMAPQINQGLVACKYTQTCINPFTPKISLVILLTVCHTIILMSVWRICFQIR